MSMGFMVAAASRKRDDRGRYAEENDNRRMEGNYGNYNRMEAPEMIYPRMNDAQEMRRQRDSRVRYMEGGTGNTMGMGYGRMTDDDGQNPYGGQSEVYRKQEERRNNGELRMGSEKTYGGKVNYDHPDGGAGNIRYFMHKADPLDRHDGKEHMMGKTRQIGFQSNTEGLDKETVMHWVESMEDDEGVRGGKYTWHQAQQHAIKVGITGQEKVLEFYWALNAMYADYHKVAKKFGVDRDDFYACLAKAFLDDPDAVEDKVEMYHRYIVKHE